MSWDWLFAAAFVVFLLYLMGNVFLKPMKLVFKVLFNSVLGVLMLWGFNLVSEFLQMDQMLKIPINPITALTAGFLGIPGVILLIVLKYLMNG